MPFLHWDGHSAHVMSSLAKLYKNLEFTDCTLNTNGGLVHGHKAIFVACSPYLKELIINHNGLEIIPFKEVKYNDMKHILDFVYFGEVNVSDPDMPSLIETAQLLQITIADNMNFSEKSSTNCTCDRSTDDRGPENFQDELAPFTFVAVPTFSIKSEHIDDDESASCGSTSALKNSLEEIPLNSDTTKTRNVEGEKEFQSELEVKVEIKEENDGNEFGLKVPKNASITKALEMNCTAHEMEHSCDGLTARVNDNNIMTTENICEEESIENETLLRTADCDYSKSFLAEGMKDLKTESKSISAISKHVLKEVKRFVTCRDIETNDDNDVLTLKEVSETLKCGAVNMSLKNFDQDVQEGLDMPDTKRLKTKETAVVLGGVGTLCKMRMGNKDSALEELSTSGTRIQHMGIPAGVKPFKCEICEMSFCGKSNLNKHMRIHSGVKPFKCDICEALFSENGNLKKHMRTHTGEKPFKCDICESSFSKNDHLKKHMRTHTGEKPFKCDICEVSFTNEGNLKMHLRIHSGEKPFKCDICESSFSQNGNLKKHMRTHTGDKPFKCYICESSFSQSGHVERHMQIHTGMKPFKCDICDAFFSDNGHLKTHMRTHTGEKLFKCDICESTFSHNCNLKTHMRTHTGEKPYKCDICESLFTHPSSLKTHMRKHTGEKPYKCDICKVSFVSNSILKRHLRTHTSK